MNKDELAKEIKQIEPLLFTTASEIVGVTEAEDVLQDVFVRLCGLVERKRKIERPFIVKVAKNIAIDKWRKRKRITYSSWDEVTTPFERDQDKGSELSFDVSSGENVDYFLRDLSSLEKEIFLRKNQYGQTHKETAIELARSHDSVRKAYQRASGKVSARRLFSLIVDSDFETFNQTRMLEADVCRVAPLCLDNPEALKNLFAVFDYKELNRSIQNATWILGRLCSHLLKAESFLVDQLKNGDLYRGNKNYISEALLDLSYRKHIYLVRREFILRMDEMEDRIRPENYTSEESLSLNQPCIYDVKHVRQIGREISHKEAENLKKMYLSGRGTEDFRRCLAFELLRIHSHKSELARSVVKALHHETDQTNAYFVTKYLRNWGKKEHPDIYDAETLRALESVAYRWSANRYFENSVKVIHDLSS